MNTLLLECERTKIICGGWGMYITGNTTAVAQRKYAILEACEILEAEMKGDIAEIKDGIGDTLVCLINEATLSGLNIQLLLHTASNAPQFDIGTTNLIHAMSSAGATISECIAKLESVAGKYRLNLLECLEAANNVISKRKGQFINGVFIKEMRI